MKKIGLLVRARGRIALLALLAMVFMVHNVGATGTFPDATITVDPSAINTNVGTVFNTAFGTGITVIGLMIAVGFILKGLRAKRG